MREVASCGLGDFIGALRSQLSNRQRVVRSFDVGGSGVKTALFSALALGAALREYEEGECEDLAWLQPPTSLGSAPGEHSFDEWLRHSVPSLQGEVDDPSVCFGVSVGGDVDHASGLIRDWWPGGGHPRQWTDRPDPLVADLMGLPPQRTFAIHDGEAHLLGCSRCHVPPPNLGCLALGTGVGFGLSDDTRAVVDSSDKQGVRSTCLGGVPISGAPYRGVWKQWVDKAEDSGPVQQVMARDFANMAKPWRMPWVSLVLGRRGMELAEAAFGCPAPDNVAEIQRLDTGGTADPREAAVDAYGAQWLHFLHTQFVPQFCSGTRRHPVHRLCFAGGVTESNWPLLERALLDPDTGALRPLSDLTSETTSCFGRSAKKAARARTHLKTAANAEAKLEVFFAPRGSALIGAGIYALAGIGGRHIGIWAV